MKKSLIGSYGVMRSPATAHTIQKARMTEPMTKLGRRTSSRSRSRRAWRRSALTSIGARAGRPSPSTSSVMARSASISTTAAADDGVGGRDHAHDCVDANRARGFIHAITRSAKSVQSM